MTEINLIETSLRDGNQSLWGATGIDTARTLAAVPLIGRAGFSAIDFTSSTHMGVAVRYMKEDPWQRIRLVREALPGVPLQFLSTGFRFISWQTAVPEFMHLAYRTLMRNGIDRFAIADPMNEAAAVQESARAIKASGEATVIAALCYSISPFHTDEHYVAFATALAAMDEVNAVYLKDPGGLLTPERARILLPQILKVLRGKPFELHSHNTIGLADLTYLAAADMGVNAFQVASGALGDGTSQPRSGRLVANLVASGHTVAVDQTALGELEALIDAMANAESLPAGAPLGFDAAYMRHQMPGGMLTTMRRQLAEIGRSHLEGAVMEEMSRVRGELGWPVVMTPFSQMLMTQSLLNVTESERYARIPDEVVRYALGLFGRPNLPIAADVMDRIEAMPRTKTLREEAGMASVAALRKSLGTDLSDEEFLLRATMPADQVDRMRPSEGNPYAPGSRPLLRLLEELADRPHVTHVSLSRPGFSMTLDRGELTQ